MHTDTSALTDAEDAAWRRYQQAQADRNSWAVVIADAACQGHPAAEATLTTYLVARAATAEARADWEAAMDHLRGARTEAAS